MIRLNSAKEIHLVGKVIRLENIRNTLDKNDDTPLSCKKYPFIKIHDTP